MSAGFTPRCPRCQGAMEEGFLPEFDQGVPKISSWVAGPPEIRRFFGVKVRGKRRLPTTTYRCKGCGFLEFYAVESKA